MILRRVRRLLVLEPLTIKPTNVAILTRRGLVRAFETPELL